MPAFPCPARSLVPRVLRVGCGVTRDRCPVPCASCFAPRASCLVPRASCFVPHASCLVPRASCLVPLTCSHWLSIPVVYPFLSAPCRVSSASPYRPAPLCPAPYASRPPPRTTYLLLNILCPRIALPGTSPCLVPQFLLPQPCTTFATPVPWLPHYSPCTVFLMFSPSFP